MRRIVLLLSLLSVAVSAWAEGVAQKNTYLYARDGADSLLLDHYVAPVEGRRPCVVFLFGGGFSGGTRDDGDYLPYFEFLNGEGCDVVSIDYRLGMKEVHSPSMLDFFGAMQHSIDIAVEDLFRATNFILSYADQWQIDSENIVISGSSAGAIAVLQAEYIRCNRLPMSQLLPANFRYAGVISFAGAVFSLDGAPRWSGAAAPMLLFHGTADRRVPYNKVALFGRGMYGSKYIATRLQESANPYWFYTVEYQTHAMASKPMCENHAEIALFLKEFVFGRRVLQRTSKIVDGSIPKCKTFFLPTDYINSNY